MHAFVPELSNTLIVSLLWRKGVGLFDMIATDVPSSQTMSPNWCPYWTLISHYPIKCSVPQNDQADHQVSHSASQSHHLELRRSKIWSFAFWYHHLIARVTSANFQQGLGLEWKKRKKKVWGDWSPPGRWLSGSKGEWGLAWPENLSENSFWLVIFVCF